MKCFFSNTGITIDPNGDIVPCCRFRKTGLEYQNIEDVDSLIPIPSTKIFSDMTSELDKNIWYRGCVRCQRDEEINITSRRQLYETRQSRVIDVSLGNVCNLKCIMCNGNFSTQWYSDQKILVDAGFGSNYASLDQRLSKTLSKESIDKIIDWIESESTPVEVEFKGGEPLATPTSQYFFEKLTKVKNKIDASVTTNGTFIPEWFKSVCKKINVILSVSFDGSGEVYDYIRGTEKYNFELFENNLNEFKKLPVKLRLNFVVQNSNIHQLKECIDKYSSTGINLIFLRNPPWLQIWNMPEESKAYIYELLSTIPVDSFKYHKIKEVIDNIHQPCNDKEYKQFIKFTAILDKRRNKSLPSIAPHLYTKQALEEYNNIQETFYG